MRSLQTAHRLVCVSRCSLLLHALSITWERRYCHSSDEDREGLGADGAVRGAEGARTHTTKTASVVVSSSQRTNCPSDAAQQFSRL